MQKLAQLFLFIMLSSSFSQKSYCQMWELSFPLDEREEESQKVIEISSDEFLLFGPSYPRSGSNNLPGVRILRVNTNGTLLQSKLILSDEIGAQKMSFGDVIYDSISQEITLVSRLVIGNEKLLGIVKLDQFTLEINDINIFYNGFDVRPTMAIEQDGLENFVICNNLKNTTNRDSIWINCMLLNKDSQRLDFISLNAKEIPNKRGELLFVDFTIFKKSYFILIQEVNRNINDDQIKSIKLLKFDTLGNKVKEYNTVYDSADYNFLTIHQYKNGLYIVGYKNNTPEYVNTVTGIIIKLDKDLNELWNYESDCCDIYNSQFTDIAFDNDTIMVAGQKGDNVFNFYDWDAYYELLDTSGNVLKKQEWNKDSTGRFYTTNYLGNKSYLLTGAMSIEEVPFVHYNLYAARYNVKNLISKVTYQEEESKEAINIHPNPTSNYLTISNVSGRKMLLFNFLGKLVKVTKLINYHTYQMNMIDLPAGPYILKIKDIHGNIIDTKRIIKI